MGTKRKTLCIRTDFRVVFLIDTAMVPSGRNVPANDSNRKTTLGVCHFCGTEI